ncbi:NACHT domain-containing protein [Streptosporangium vulgare]|uniref:NACHT domain-containing protein n=1 Tax=Streptosporangium vulgare TaxID=46190 RepID=A0ABV5TWC0_9ACTN
MVEIAEWFNRHMREAGHNGNSLRVASRRRFPLTKDRVYDLLNGLKLPDWEHFEPMVTLIGQDPGAVRPMWERAHRLYKAGKEQTVSAWTEIPVADTRLRELLADQRDAADRFPYDLLNVSRPTLYEVYVEQDVRPAVSGPPREGEHDRRLNSSAVCSLRDVLGRHDHLFITGGPGAGKTTLGRLLVRQIAQAWLADQAGETPWCEEPVIGLFITAADVLTGSWTEALMTSCRPSRLTQPIDPQVFARRTYGVRWLVVVDGLDEISSPEKRAEVLRALSARAEYGTPYRLVITARPLPQEELEPLRDRSVGFYTLSGFDSDRQRAFAERWFAAQHVPDPAATASAFLEQAQTAGLVELLKVPLLATIAATFHTRYPDNPLPRGRMQLYERFLRELVDARGGQRSLRKALRARWEELACAPAADWVLAHQDRLVLHLAQMEVVETRPFSLLAEAADWVRKNLPADMRLREGLDRDLGRLLTLAGVLVFDGTELSFLHRSFAEFIAAEKEAEAIPAEFPGLAGWTEKIQNDASRNYVFFTLAHWACRPENQVSTIVRLLFEQDLQHRIMALRLVTAGVPMGAKLEEAVINRLLGEPMEQGYRFVNDAENQLFTSLSELRGNTRLAERLIGLARTHGAPTSQRVAAAAAYARVADLREGVDLLNELGEQVGDPTGLRAVINQLAELDAADIVRRIGLLRRLADCGSVWEQLVARSDLVDLGETDGAVELARMILSNDEPSGQMLEFAGEVWLAVAGEQAVPEILQAIAIHAKRGAWAHAGIAQLWFGAGYPALAEPHARLALSYDANDEDVSEIIVSWTEACGVQGALEAARVFLDSSGQHSYLLFSARELIKRGHTSAAEAVARTVLHEPDTEPLERSFAAELLVSVAGASAVGEVLHRVDASAVSPNDLPRFIVKLAKHDQAAAASLASRVLTDFRAANGTFTQAAELLLEVSGPAAAEQIIRALDARPTGYTPLAAQLLPVLTRHQAVEVTSTLCRRVLLDPVRTPGELHSALQHWIAAGQESSAEVVAYAEAVGGLSGDERARLAAFLEEIGEKQAAISLWCKVIIQPALPLELRWRTAERLLTLGAANAAITALESALQTASGDEESRLWRLLNWVRPTPFA